MKHLEENLQAACVKWFRIQYPQYDGLLFHVPNGGRRNLKEAARLKAEGVTPGVADLLLLVPQWYTTWRGYEGCLYAGLCIEMKTPKGRQSPEQKEWQYKVEGMGYKYAVCHSLDEFMDTINNYLNRNE